MVAAFQRPDGAQFGSLSRLCDTNSRYLSAVISTLLQGHWIIPHLMLETCSVRRRWICCRNLSVALSIYGKRAENRVSFWWDKNVSTLSTEQIYVIERPICTHLSLNMSVLLMPLNVKQIPSSVKTSVNKSEQLYSTCCHLHFPITSSKRSATCHPERRNKRFQLVHRWDWCLGLKQITFLMYLMT